jgi:hypothetical protein
LHHCQAEALPRPESGRQYGKRNVRAEVIVSGVALTDALGRHSPERCSRRWSAISSRLHLRPGPIANTALFLALLFASQIMQIVSKRISRDQTVLLLDRSAN